MTYGHSDPYWAREVDQRRPPVEHRERLVEREARGGSGRLRPRCAISASVWTRVQHPDGRRRERDERAAASAARARLAQQRARRARRARRRAQRAQRRRRQQRRDAERHRREVAQRSGPVPPARVHGAEHEAVLRDERGGDDGDEQRLRRDLTPGAIPARRHARQPARAARRRRARRAAARRARSGSARARSAPGARPRRPGEERVRRARGRRSAARTAGRARAIASAASAAHGIAHNHAAVARVARVDARAPDVPRSEAAAASRGGGCHRPALAELVYAPGCRWRMSTSFRSRRSGHRTSSGVDPPSAYGSSPRASAARSPSREHRHDARVERVRQDHRVAAGRAQRLDDRVDRSTVSSGCAPVSGSTLRRRTRPRRGGRPAA